MLAVKQGLAVTEDETTELRHSLGKFATGVTVVTCSGERGPCGITANSFNSVSLDPPLVLWSIAKDSDLLGVYLDAEFFAINVLGQHQDAISRHFAQAAQTDFDGIDYRLSGRGVPLLPGTIAGFECRLRDVIDCGDHHIIIGEVEHFRSGDGEPLLFFGGEYHSRGDRLGE